MLLARRKKEEKEESLQSQFLLALRTAESLHRPRALDWVIAATCAVAGVSFGCWAANASPTDDLIVRPGVAAPLLIVIAYALTGIVLGFYAIPNRTISLARGLAPPVRVSAFALVGYRLDVYESSLHVLFGIAMGLALFTFTKEWRALMNIEPVDAIRQRSWVANSRKFSERFERVADWFVFARSARSSVVAIFVGTGLAVTAAFALLVLAHVESPRQRVNDLALAIGCHEVDRAAAFALPDRRVAVRAQIEDADSDDTTWWSSRDAAYRYSPDRRLVARLSPREGPVDTFWALADGEWVLDEVSRAR